MPPCTTCQAPAIAFRPGSSPRVCAGVTYDRGEPDQTFCRVCWLARFGARQGDLFGRGM